MHFLDSMDHFPLGGMTIDSSKSGEHDKNLTNLTTHKKPHNFWLLVFVRFVRFL